MSRFFENLFEDYSDSKHADTELIDKDKVIQLVKNYVQTILVETKKNTYKLRDDLYVGDAGIAFMFWKLSQSSDLKDLFPCLEHASFFINRAKQIAHGKASDSRASIAFLCGNAGIAAVSAVISNELGKSEEVSRSVVDFQKGLKVCKSMSYDADEILVGRAGYLSGAYWLNQVLPTKPIHNELIKDVCSVLVARGREYSIKRKAPLPLMYEYHESDYLGAAHGLCSILHMLLESPWFIQSDGKFNNISKTKLGDIKKSVEYFADIQDADGNFPTRLFNSDKKLIHWCHGCSGAIYVLAKAFLILKDERYLKGCKKCADSIWRHGLLRKGPGICHGIAGSGYAFLLMYRLTGERKYLYRAAKFMEFLTSDTFLDGARTPDRPYSLYEGCAGTVCFLADLLNPQASYFPFMDVFSVKHNSE
ncbi:lanC-like protein 3 homolog [Aedes albopictus]|uniref:Lanthionine synthetase c-like protein 1 n=1 Tax=Aedes albopictus TaxID=7160 RepID=A0ABM1ZFN4_AEDAL